MTERAKRAEFYLFAINIICYFFRLFWAELCSLWSTPSEHSDIYAALIGHHHLVHEHTQMQHAEMQHAKTATSNCSSERPSHVVFHVHVIGTLLWTLHWS